MKTLKVRILLLSLILFSSHVYAQDTSDKSLPPQATLANDEIQIYLTASSLSATFQNKTLPVSSIVQLDDYFKSNPDLVINKAIIIIKGKIDPEQNRILGVILGKNRINSVRAFTRLESKPVVKQNILL